MKKNYSYYESIIEKCYFKQGKIYLSVSEETLKCNLSLIDEYIDMITDVFLSHGLQEDHEPNEYGLQLEDVKRYLLEMRYAIVG